MCLCRRRRTAQSSIFFAAYMRNASNRCSVRICEYIAQCICLFISMHIVPYQFQVKDVINFMEILSICTDYINYDIFLGVFVSDVMISKQHRIVSVGGVGFMSHNRFKQLCRCTEHAVVLIIVWSHYHPVRSQHCRTHIKLRRR